MTRGLYGIARFVVAAVFLCGWPASSRAQPGLDPDPEVIGLEFEGNEAFSYDELAGAILTEKTTCRSFLFFFPFPLCPLTSWGFAHNRAFLDRSELPRDLLRLHLYYRQRGFRDARVDTLIERTDGKVRVRFLISENEPTLLGSLGFRGFEGVVDTAKLHREFPLEPGERFDLVELGAAEQRITQELRGQGYIDATILREYFIPAGSRRADLMLEIRPGPRVRIGDVTITGAGRISESVVWQFLTFGRGQYVNEDRILESQRNLYGLEALRYANIATQRRAGVDTLLDVRVEVATAPPRSVRLGFGLSTTECGQLEFRLAHRNFLGGARQFRVSGRLANLGAEQLEGDFPCTGVGEDPAFQDPTYRVGVEFQQPYFFSGRNRVSASLFLERETVPDLFVRDSRGGELALVRRLRSRMPLSLGWRPELTGFGKQSADIYFCVNFAFCQPEDIALLTQRRWLSPVILTWRWDRTNDLFSPTGGFYTTVTVERAGRETGSDYRYVRLAVEAAGFEELTPGWVLAARLRTGLVTATGGRVFDAGEDVLGGVIHPRKRFFAGGPQSVRGFGLNLLGPTVLVVEAERDCADEELEECVARLEPSEFDERPEGGDAAAEASFELRFRLSDRWTAVGFVDVGQVWEDLSEIRAPVATPGIGFRYRSPVGPIRLDVGYNPTGASEKEVVAVLPDGEIEELETRVVFDPFTFEAGRLTEVFRRIQLQLSIGEAF